ncbi:hypothetical protein KBX35_12785 [Micromonospora sp. C32]|uniref:hypothetical protein n=1 Tax=unclassified Micromonospora TaxID=2617518 RepID=UPI001B38EAE2|nr:MULTISPECIES: hypothetical protein [unclassified Micromonospora]MBQ1044647.1 hypothetical protein [Micromonospora sp. C72]MBQ1055661.1 hypothetical protein [Micromonospora sp. C32]
MSVGRHAARWAIVGALLGGLIAVPASPASARDDRVGLRSAGSFTAGGSPGAVTVEVRKRTDGCVQLRTAIGLRLEGLRADQVRVQVAAGGRWTPVQVSGGDGAVATAAVAPVDRPLCKGKGVTVRYRVSFLAGAVGGRLELAGEASAANGDVLGRAGGSARLVGAPPTPSPSPSRKPSPTPTPSASETTPADATDTSPVAAAVAPATAAADDSSFGGSMIMWFGIALVLVGAALIVLLLRRNRADRSGGGPVADPPPVPLPRSTTTYRSGATGAAPTVYGGAPAPRPAGNVYGAPAPAPGPTPPAPSPTPPAAGPMPPAPAGGDATSVLPRLPD